MRTGVYPGTFDPITLGHMDIIRRGAKLVDRLVIGVTTNPSKSPMFTVEERIEMVRREIVPIEGDIHVVSFDSLLMDFAEREGASVIVRGLRAVADFEYEYQMAGMNQQLNDRIETIFLMADVSLQPIASRLVKEIAIYGGDIRKFVTAAVAEDVSARVERIGAGARSGEYPQPRSFDWRPRGDPASPGPCAEPCAAHQDTDSPGLL
jgi:pantetheine-phosphate adenylyltransferase